MCKAIGLLNPTKMIRQLTDFLHLIRWKNVGIYLLLQGLFYYKFSQRADISLFVVLVLVFLLWGMAGNIQNNIYDYELDQNKPEFIRFSIRNYTYVYVVLYLLGILVLLINTSLVFSLLALLFPLLLSLYNIYLKKILLLGNFVIAFLTATSVFIPVWLGLRVAVHKGNMMLVFYILIAFLLTLMRELVKDMEDAEPDKRFGYKTMPVWSQKLSVWVLVIYYVVFGLLLYEYYGNLEWKRWILVCVLGVILLSLALHKVLIKRYKTATKLLKLLMLLGILTILL